MRQFPKKQKQTANAVVSSQRCAKDAVKNNPRKTIKLQSDASSQNVSSCEAYTLPYCRKYLPCSIHKRAPSSKSYSLNHNIRVVINLWRIRVFMPIVFFFLKSSGVAALQPRLGCLGLLSIGTNLLEALHDIKAREVGSVATGSSHEVRSIHS